MDKHWLVTSEELTCAQHREALGSVCTCNALFVSLQSIKGDTAVEE